MCWAKFGVVSLGFGQVMVPSGEFNGFLFLMYLLFAIFGLMGFV